MKKSFVALVVCLVPTLGFAAEWQTDYAQACKKAKDCQKPILVCFENRPSSTVVREKIDCFGQLANNFVVVCADKSTPEGQKLYQTFKMRADSGVVVVERNQAWQYARFERELSKQEMQELLNKTAQAEGKPASEIVLVSHTQTIPATQSVVPATQSNYWNPQPTWSNAAPYCPSCQRNGW